MVYRFGSVIITHFICFWEALQLVLPERYLNLGQGTLRVLGGSISILIKTKYSYAEGQFYAQV